MFPAVALLEVSSIARGMVVTDACAKKAPVKLLASMPISPGRYITLFWGEVGEVEESFAEGVRVADTTLVDKLFLPQAHEQLIEALLAVETPKPVDSIAIVETFTIAATLLSADAACKAAEVGLLEVRLATGIGGKAYFVLTGQLYDVEAGAEAAKAILSESQLARLEIIQNPSPDFLQLVW